MIPCFVISLQRSVDRRARIGQEFNREGVAFEFIDAIDANTLPARTVISPAFGLPIVAGDIACTMSHGLAMQTMLKRGYDRAVIFEDDATLLADFAARLEAVLRAPVQWDVLKLSGSPNANCRTVADISTHKIVEPAIASLLAQGYTITAQGARKLIPYASKPIDLFDHVLQSVWRTGIRLYEVEPRLVGAFNGASTIPNRDAYNSRPNVINAWRRRVWKWQRSLWARRHLIGFSNIHPR